MGRWVYGLDHNGDRGEVKGLKNKTPFRYLCESEQGRRRLETCLLSAFGYGAEGPQEWWARPHTLPSVRLTLTAAKIQRPHKETKCKQAGEEQLAEGSQEG